MNPSAPPYLNTTLSWYPGPANGGGGTAGKDDDGAARWYDCETLLIVIETNEGRETVLLHIEADEDSFIARCANTGDVYGDWEPEQWSWWAKVDGTVLPPSSIP